MYYRYRVSCSEAYISTNACHILDKSLRLCSSMWGLETLFFFVIPQFPYTLPTIINHSNAFILFALPSCDLGAAFCTSNVCSRPGSTLPPAPASILVTAPAPAPVEAPTEAPAPAPALSPVDAASEALAEAPAESSSPGGGQGSSTVYDSSLRCNGDRRRKEIRDMTDEEWNAFASAVQVLRNRPSKYDPSINQFEDLGRIHRESVLEAHGGSFFLPWHRLFLLLFENLLREVNPSVTIPYWNWAVDGEDAAMSDVWSRVGGSRRAGGGSPGCIPDGPFANIWISNPEHRCVRRGFVSYQSGSIVPFDNWLTIQALMDRDVSYAQFAAALESTHGFPHVGVGGDMSILAAAPNDPLFYFHHGFVDLIYLRWQFNENGIPGRYGGTQPPYGNVDRDSVMQAFQRSVRYSQRLRCVEYQDYSGSFALNSGSLNLTVQELPVDFIKNNNINKTRADMGRVVLQEALNAALSSK